MRTYGAFRVLLSGIKLVSGEYLTIKETRSLSVFRAKLLGRITKYLKLSKIFLLIICMTMGAALAHSKCRLVLASQAKDTRRLLIEHRQRLESGRASKAKAYKQYFINVNGKDVYNPTAPFFFDGQEVLAGRVESRDSESDSQIVFFRKVSANTWTPIEGVDALRLQDPFVSNIKGITVIGGVETFHKADGSLGYKTVFYKGSSFEDLEKFAEGPVGMKDIRLSQVKGSHQIVVLTRPQGAVGGRGKIGFTMLNDLSELTPENILKAELLTQQFADTATEGDPSSSDWGGANEIHDLGNSRIGVLSHIARFDHEGNRHYYVSSFTLNTETGEYTPMRILLERGETPAGASKRHDLKDVLFSGGLKRLNYGRAELWVGAGDAETYRVLIEDPFLWDEI